MHKEPNDSIRQEQSSPLDGSISVSSRSYLACVGVRDAPLPNQVPDMPTQCHIGHALLQRKQCRRSVEL